MLKEERLFNEFYIDIENVIERLKVLLDDVNDYYSVVYKSIPEIERNLHLAEEETKVLLDYLIHAKNEEDSNHPQLIYKALKEIKSDFVIINELMLNQQEIKDMLNSFIDESSQEVSFNKLLIIVKETEKILNGVNLMAINAVIFASNSDNGQGFGVISTEIQKMSKVLENNLDNISKLLKSLSKWHASLKKNIREIISIQEQATELHTSEIDATFKSMIDSIQIINEILNSVIKNVNEVVNPFQDMMVSIQKEDIVKQNIENIIKSLEIIKEKYTQYQTMDTTDKYNPKKLDLIKFINTGMELIKQLAHMSFEELFSSIDEIVDICNGLLENLNEVKHDAENISNHFYNEDNNLQYVGSVNITFNTVTSLVNKLVYKLESVNKIVNDNKIVQRDFSNYINHLSDEIVQIKNSIKRLRKIELLARIELARMGEGNSNDDGFTNQLEKIMDRIVNITTENTEVFLRLKTLLEGELNRFEEVMLDNQNRVDLVIDKVESSMERIDMTNKIINEAILALYKDIEYLEENLIKVSFKLRETERIRKIGSELTKTIDISCQRLNDEWENILANSDIDSWDLKSSSLKEIVNQFTTYLEREIANNFLEQDGSSMDSNAGELTLF
ncbi:methyl-accepting chemotaxis protein [Caldisalinibacter kiritimatiensis]|uniref:Methyl-accepting chemotaxis protein n=1 Tax=Caldisalinibacter kiritimatiensis TaxID=1304284 RepID=R1CKK5_9FIRM|nr:methyl-accepting chemotaxis protein [Caldisalinibacter kiritimatiensis]EOC99255.1 hypothetical protein L21TH_2719 [Caldisalinibacter kiritimatiensis]